MLNTVEEFRYQVETFRPTEREILQGEKIAEVDRGQAGVLREFLTKASGILREGEGRDSGSSNARQRFKGRPLFQVRIGACDFIRTESLRAPSGVFSDFPYSPLHSTIGSSKSALKNKSVAADVGGRPRSLQAQIERLLGVVRRSLKHRRMSLTRCSSREQPAQSLIRGST